MPYEYLNNPTLVDSGMIYDVYKPGSLYSGNEERSDIYGASMPIRAGQVMGNMYGSGPNYMTNRQMMTPLARQYEARYPYSYTLPPPPQPQPQPPQPKSDRENFTLDYTSPESNTPIEADVIASVEPPKYNIPLIFIMLLLLFAAMFYWIKSGNLVISKYIFRGRPAEPWHYVIFAAITTIIFGIVFYFSGLAKVINPY